MSGGTKRQPLSDADMAAYTERDSLQDLQDLHDQGLFPEDDLDPAFKPDTPDAARRPAP